MAKAISRKAKTRAQWAAVICADYRKTADAVISSAST
jgi:hypothetical protein